MAAYGLILLDTWLMTTLEAVLLLDLQALTTGLR